MNTEMIHSRGCEELKLFENMHRAEFLLFMHVKKKSLKSSQSYSFLLKCKILMFTMSLQQIQIGSNAELTTRRTRLEGKKDETNYKTEELS